MDVKTLDRLQALAEKAQPGKWYFEFHPTTRGQPLAIVSHIGGEHTWANMRVVMTATKDSAEMANWSYAAACSPELILEMIAVVRKCI